MLAVSGAATMSAFLFSADRDVHFTTGHCSPGSAAAHGTTGRMKQSPNYAEQELIVGRGLALQTFLQQMQNI